MIRSVAGGRLRRFSGLTWAALIATVIVVVLPMGFLLYGALQTGAPGAAGAAFTLANLKAVYGTTTYLSPLLHTLVLATLSAVIATPLGTFFAWLVARVKLRQKRALELMIIAPLYLSPLLGTLAWIALAAPGSGFVNALIGHELLGRGADLVNIYSFEGIVFVMAMFHVPHAYLLNVGPFQQVDANLEDAARLVGAKQRTVWLRVTAPLVLPSILSSGLLIFILSAEQFIVPTLLGVKSNYQTIPLVLYNGFSQGQPSLGVVSALATQLFIITFVGLYFYRRTVRSSRKYVAVTGKGASAKLIDLGPWTYPAAGVALLYIVLAVVLPVVALVVGSLERYPTARFTSGLWTLSNYDDFFAAGGLQSISTTLILGFGGGLATLVLAFVIAYVTLRERGIASATLDYFASMSVAVPGIVMAVGLLWAYTTLPLPIYGTIWLLIIAMAGRFVGQAVRLASASLAQVDPDLEGAGRIVGMTKAGVLRRITIGIVSRSVLSAWMMIFVLIVVEVATVIMLYTPNTITLSILLWNQGAMNGAVGAFTVGIVQIILVAAILAIVGILARSRGERKRKRLA